MKRQFRYLTHERILRRSPLVVCRRLLGGTAHVSSFRSHKGRRELAEAMLNSLLRFVRHVALHGAFRQHPGSTFLTLDSS